MGSAVCFVPAPPAEHVSGGSEEIWEDMAIYVNQPSTAIAAVVLVSEVFGWRAPLLRKLADKVAEAGFIAVVPDLLYGDAYDPETTLPSFLAWLQAHPPDTKPVDDCRKLINVLRSKNISSVGMVGFCWGAKVAIISSKEYDIRATVLCHPSFLTMENIKRPVAILAAETDHYSPVDVIMSYKTELVQKNQVQFVKIYPGTTHGWTIRYDVNDQTSLGRAQEAHEDMINWLKTHLD